MALVMAIVVLLVISLLAAAVMQNLSVQRKISGHGLRTSRALSAAEAGLAEMLSRMRSGEIELDGSTPTAAAQIFLVANGLVPAVGVDTAAFATVQPAGTWLDYSSSSRGEDVLTLGFRRDAAGAIVRWDEAQTPALNTACGMPVFQVTSTGRVNGDRTRILTEFIWRPHHLTLNAALVVGGDVTLEGGIAICGHQHSSVTDFTSAAQGRSGTPPCSGHEVGLGDLPAVWVGGAFANNGALLHGLPSTTIEGQSGFHEGPWEPLGVSSTDMAELLGAAVTAPASYDGLVRLDDDGTFGNGTGAYSIAGLSGEGVLYVDGDLTLTGNVTYRGMLFVEGRLASTATGAVVGAVVVRCRAGGGCSLTNGPSVVYSRDAINEVVGRASREIVTLSWREVR